MVTGAKLESLGAGTFGLRGRLDFDSTVLLWQQTNALFQTRESSAIVIDLADVVYSDSSGVALLVEWLRQAGSRERQIRFVNIPHQMRAIIRVTDLEDLLPLA